MKQMEDMKMTERNNNLDDLISAIESIRAEKYPELPKELLSELILVEYNYQDNRVQAQSKYLDILEKYFNKA